jgi:predicted transposase/invertase (TIGR01784 family)
MARYLDPKNDLVFKRIFGEHENLCISLLNALLPLDEPITQLRYESPEAIPEIPLMKNSIVDVHCTDAGGRQFIVEMQLQWTESFMQRVLFNASKAYVRQAGKGFNYKLLQPVYALNLVDAVFDRTTEEFYHDYKVVNIADTNKRIEGLELIFVELPKFPQAAIDGLKRLQVLWLRFLTAIEGNAEEVPEELKEDPDVWEAVKQLEQSSYTRGQLEYYDRVKDVIMTQRMFRDDALEEGLTKGLAKGLAEGKAEGLAEGEAQKALEVARKMKAKGYPVKEIEAITGLSPEAVRSMES